jgi:cyclohexadieny/prephenate dehydrogenase
VGQFPRIVRDIREHIKRGAVVTDAGSVKAQVIRELEPLMPEGVSFVGGHPIAGKECSGADAASPDLFNNRAMIRTVEQRQKSWGSGNHWEPGLS